DAGAAGDGPAQGLGDDHDQAGHRGVGGGLDVVHPPGGAVRRPSAGGVEDDGGHGQHPGEPAQDRGRGADRAQEQIGGDQPDDPDVDADGEDVGEPAPPPAERQVAHGAVGPGEADDREGDGEDRDDGGGGQQTSTDGDQGVAVGGGAAGGYRRSSLIAGHRVRGHGGTLSSYSWARSISTVRRSA